MSSTLNDEQSASGQKWVFIRLQGYLRAGADCHGCAGSLGAEWHQSQSAARTEAEVALRRIQSGKLFADVASTSSVDAGTRVLGGDLGWHELTRFPEAFANTVVSLAPAGLAAEPTQTIAGWHVIELLETQMGKESFPKLPALRGRIIAFLQDARTSSVLRVIAQAVCRKRVDPQVPASVVQSAGNARVGVEMRVEDGRVTDIISMTGPSVFHAAVKDAVRNYGCDKLDRPVIATQTFQF